MKLMPCRLFLLILASLAPWAKADIALGVDHAELITDLTAGTKHSLTFNVNNPGTEAVPITVYSEDFAIAAGTVQFTNQAHPRGLGQRVSVFPASFDLKPGESKEVTVTLDAGPGPFSPGSYYSVIFVQTSRLSDAPVAQGARGVSQLKLVRRIGVFLFADNAPETKPLPADVTITAMEKTDKGVALMLNNPSAYMRMVPTGVLQVTPVAGGKPRAISIRPFRLLPNSAVRVEVALPAKLKGAGESSVLATVDYGAEELLVGEAQFKL